MSAFDGPLGHGSDFVNVFPVGLGPFDAERFPALGETVLDHRRTLEAGSHGVTVVFDDVNHGEIKERRHIQRLVKASLIDRAVAEKTEGGSF